MKHIFLFLFLAITITASAQNRQDRTSYAVSQTLEAALISSGYENLTLPDRHRAFYDGSQNTRIFCGEQPDNFNGLRTIVVIGTQTEFDFLEFTDTTVTRYWIYRELEVVIGQLPGVSGFTTTQNGQTWTVTISLFGVNYTGTDNRRVDAVSKALTNALTGQQQAILQANGRRK